MIVQINDINQTLNREDTSEEEEQEKLVVTRCRNLSPFIQNHIYHQISNPQIFIKLSLQQDKCATIFGQVGGHHEKEKENSFQKQTLDQLLQFSLSLQGHNQILKKQIHRRLIKDEKITNSQRKLVWLFLSGASIVMKQNLNYYQKLLEKQKMYPNSYFSSINKDVSRTVGDKIQDQIEKDVMENKIRNVLCASSIRNPFLGYIQGLNYIVYYILSKGFTEEETFWIFVQIIECILPLDYYTNMIHLLIDQNMLLNYLKLTEPKLIKYFQDNNIQMRLFTMQWFLCLFIRDLNQEICEIFWDNFIYKGHRFVFKTMLVLLNLMKDKLMSSDEPRKKSYFLNLNKHFQKIQKENFQNEILNFTSNFKDQELFKKKLNQREINKKAFVIAREMFLDKEVSYSNLNSFQNGDQTRKKSDKEVIQGFPQINLSQTCNVDSPVCLYVIEFHQILKQSFSYTSLRMKQPMNVINDYLNKFISNKQNQNQQKIQTNNDQPAGQELINLQSRLRKSAELFNEMEHQGDDDDDLLIGRHIHICRENFSFEKSENSLREKSKEKQTQLQTTKQQLSSKDSPSSDDNTSYGSQDEFNKSKLKPSDCNQEITNFRNSRQKTMDCIQRLGDLNNSKEQFYINGQKLSALQIANVLSIDEDYSSRSPSPKSRSSFQGPSIKLNFRPFDVMEDSPSIKNEPPQKFIQELKQIKRNQREQRESVKLLLLAEEAGQNKGNHSIQTFELSPPSQDQIQEYRAQRKKGIYISSRTRESILNSRNFVENSLSTNINTLQEGDLQNLGRTSLRMENQFLSDFNNDSGKSSQHAFFKSKKQNGEEDNSTPKENFMISWDDSYRSSYIGDFQKRESLDSIDSEDFIMNEEEEKIHKEKVQKLKSRKRSQKIQHEFQDYYMNFYMEAAQKMINEEKWRRPSVNVEKGISNYLQVIQQSFDQRDSRDLSKVTSNNNFPNINNINITINNSNNSNNNHNSNNINNNYTFPEIDTTLKENL